MSSVQQETRGTASASANNQAPLPSATLEPDIHSLQAPAGIEQPYLDRMVPVHSSSYLDNGNAAATAATRSAYGVGWSIVQGPPSLFTAGSRWIGYRG